MDEAVALFLMTRIYRWAKPAVESDAFPVGLVHHSVLTLSEWRAMDQLERLRLLVGNFTAEQLQTDKEFGQLWREWKSSRALEQPTCPTSLWWPAIEAELRKHAQVRMGIVHTECLNWLRLEWTPRDLVEALTDAIRYLLRKEHKSGEPVGNPTAYVLGCVKREFARRQEALQAAPPTLPEFEEVPL